jgi:hypothetical protein
MRKQSRVRTLMTLMQDDLLKYIGFSHEIICSFGQITDSTACISQYIYKQELQDLQRFIERTLNDKPISF